MLLMSPDGMIFLIQEPSSGCAQGEMDWREMDSTVSETVFEMRRSLIVRMDLGAERVVSRWRRSGSSGRSVGGRLRVSDEVIVKGVKTRRCGSGFERGSG